MYHFSSISEDPTDINTDDDDLPEWKVLPGASQRACGNLLVDRRGYSYSVKEVRGATTVWRCTDRNKKSCVCPATVRQRDYTFTAGVVEHCHAGTPGLLAAVQLRHEVLFKLLLSLLSNKCNSAHMCNICVCLLG